MIALHSVYLKPIEEVDKYLPAHRAFLKPLYAAGTVICSGPKIPRTGGFLLMNATMAQAAEIMKGDPYVIEGVAEYSMIEFDCRSYISGFEKLMKI
jgi:uncharacterized protein YciI